MSKTNEQIRFLEDAFADFDTFLSQRKFEDCKAVIENVGDLGYENEALKLHQVLNRAKTDACTCGADDKGSKHHDIECSQYRSSISLDVETSEDETTFVPFEAIIPVMTEAERRAWDEPKHGNNDVFIREGDEKFPAHVE